MKVSKTSLVLLAAGLLFAASEVSATKYAIFIHGRGSNKCSLSDTDNSYWGSASNVNGGYTKRFVNYNSQYDPRTFSSCRGSYHLYTKLNSYCKGGHTCQVMCHSAGCYTTAYLAQRYPYYWDDYAMSYVVFTGSAEGGSELASAGSWATGWSMDTALKPGNARASSFNHNDTGGRKYYVHAGYDGNWLSALLPGEDDGVVAYHSACGIAAGSNSYSNCTSSARWTNRRILNGGYYAVSGWNTSKHGYNKDHSGTMTAGRDGWNGIVSKGTISYY